MVAVRQEYFMLAPIYPPAFAFAVKLSRHPSSCAKGIAELHDDDAAKRQGLETVAQLDFERWVKGGDPSAIAVEILDERIATVTPQPLPMTATKGGDRMRRRKINDTRRNSQRH